LNPFRTLALTAAGALSLGTTLRAQEPRGGTAEIFRLYADQVAKIQVVETGSGAKAGVGTGFFVSPSGFLLTNYHVIAETVDSPDQYRAEWIGTDGRPRPAEVSAIDVVHDLAVMATDTTVARFFSLAPVHLAKGVRLYSLGHPGDLGLSIVEGTYNGNLEHALYPKAHFTGPLNPGMSGGPSLTPKGQVVGINVATEGNSISFLVPVELAIPLVARAIEDTSSDLDLTAEAGRQLRENQDRYLSHLFQGADSTVRLGPFELPTQPAPFFRCWADADRATEDKYERIVHQCSTDDYIYLSGEQSSGIVTLEHRVLISRGLNPLRFYSLYRSEFSRGAGGQTLDSSDEVTAFRCRGERRYKKFDGLYDATLRAAVLGARDVGLVTSLTLSGVSFENAKRLARLFVDRIKWVTP
jgi:serine protease Do